VLCHVTSRFVPGLELNAAFYADVVRPLLGHHTHAAALLGWGSDVLGYDTLRSTDHGWGPRLQLFVDEADIEAVQQLVDRSLPDSYAGTQVRFGWDGQPDRHWVEAVDLGRWLTQHLGLDPRAGMTSIDWLSIPQQLILGVVGGAVYADPQGELAAVRESLAYYPDDVWRWLLACQWQRLGQEEPFVGRAAEVGDELGSRLIAARLVRELMRLAFLQARAYWPYSKWFGVAFARLPGAADLATHLDAALTAANYEAREAGLVAAFELVARRHNESGAFDELDPAVRLFHDRTYRVLGAERFAAVCRDSISDEVLRAQPLVGSVDQFVDSTDVLSASQRPQLLRGIYAEDD
jgi:hypothetical protein